MFIFIIGDYLAAGQTWPFSDVTILWTIYGRPLTSLFWLSVPAVVVGVGLLLWGIFHPEIWHPVSRKAFNCSYWFYYADLSWAWLYKTNVIYLLIDHGRLYRRSFSFIFRWFVLTFVTWAGVLHSGLAQCICSHWLLGGFWRLLLILITGIYFIVSGKFVDYLGTWKSPEASARYYRERPAAVLKKVAKFHMSSGNPEDSWPYYRLLFIMDSLYEEGKIG